VLELTGSAVLRDVDTASERLDALKTLGPGANLARVRAVVELGCELAQGYRFAKPASAAAVAELAGSAGVSRCRGAAAPRAATRAS
jgi:EAL domain-containing protein (putative c-di-GMP-specific phosphodiesterase class I)